MVMGSSIIKRKVRVQICLKCSNKCNYYNGRNSPFVASKSHSIPFDLVAGKQYATSELYEYCKYYDPFSLKE